MRIELRNDNSVVLDGYINVCLRESRVLSSPTGPFVEEIKPKTFERALMKNDSVDFLFNHDRNRKLGSTKTGEIRLSEDNVGLRAIATVNDSEIVKKAKAGDLTGWSFGFASLVDEWSTRNDGMQKRTVEEIDLFEVSILDKTPAYIAQSLEARGEENVSVFTEIRTEEFQAKIEDNSVKTEDNGHKVDDPEETKKKGEEARKAPDSYYYEHLEQETILLQLKGGS
jgi:uncharacterized protein